MTKSSNTYNSIQFSIKRPDDKWIKGVVVTYRKHLREEREKQQELTFTHKNTTNILITGLSPNEMYRFSMQYVTIMGNSIPGPESSPISTRPCSIPTNLRVKDLASTSFNILWDPPFHMGTGANIDYDVTVENGKLCFFQLRFFDNLQLDYDFYNILINDIERRNIINYILFV